MNKQEYKIICKLIDLRTSIEYDLRGEYDYREIGEEDIEKLKADIKELLVEEEDKWIKKKKYRN